MSQGPFQFVGGSLSGRGLSFDVAVLVTPGPKIDPAEQGERLAEIAEVAYRQGRSLALLSWDDRFDLRSAVDGLRALSVIIGQTPTGDRYGSAADILARLLQDQEGAQ